MKQNPLLFPDSRLSLRQYAIYGFFLLAFALVFTPLASSLLIPEVMPSSMPGNDSDGPFGAGIAMLAGVLATLFVATRT